MKLSAKLRNLSGKEVSSLRDQGEIPAIVYGSNEETRSITVSRVDFLRVFREAGESSLVALDIEGKTHDVLIHDVQFDPVSDAPIHADLLVVRQDKELEVDVPLVFEGVAPAIKELGASLVKVLHELPIRTLPKNLPHNIIVDVSGLTTLDSQILVKDIKLPAGVEVTVDPEEVIVSLTVAGEEVVEEAPVADLSEIEVEKKGKQEETETPAE